MWTTPEDVRRILNVTVDQLSDAEANEFIEKAQNYVRLDTGVFLKYADLKGSIDGTNKVFFVEQVPIGDGDFYFDVDPLDVTVWAFTDEKDESTKTELSVSHVSPETGRIELTTAPSPDYKVLKIDYWHSWVLEFKKAIEEATTFITAYFFLISQFAFIPLEFSLGDLRYKFKGPRGTPAVFPYNRFWMEYQKLIYPIRKKLMESVEKKIIELEPSGVGRQELVF